MKALFYYIVKTLNLAITAVILVVCLFFVYLFYCNLVKMSVPKLGPITMYVVLSDSMAPEFHVDDAVFAIERNPETLDVGDVIAFYAFENEVTITHRIIERLDENGELVFRTQGDNNSSPDTFTTPASRVIGEIFYSMPRFNVYLEALKQKPYVVAFPIILVVVVQGIFGFLENVLKPGKSKEQEEQGERAEQVNSEKRVKKEKPVRPAKIEKPVKRVKKENKKEKPEKNAAAKPSPALAALQAELAALEAEAEAAKIDNQTKL